MLVLNGFINRKGFYMINKKISASRFLLAFCMVLPSFDFVFAEEIEIENVEENIVEEVDTSDYWGESQELMSVEEFQNYYNSETNNLARGELIRVRKVAEFNGGANWISIMSVDGQIVFCLDPTMTAGIGMEYNQSNDWLYLGWDTQYRIWEVIRFGYQEYGTDDYYIASQILIWRALGHWITPNINVDSQINQIEANIKNFGIPPSFNNQTLELDYKVGQTITDTNAVLNKYSINCPSGISCVKNGNDLTVTIEDLNFDKNGKINISSPGTNDPSWIGVAWVLPGSQSVLSMGFHDPSVRFRLNLKMSTGNLQIIKVDEYGLPGGEGHKFEVAFDENFNDIVGTYTTNEEGFILIEDYLPGGIYYLREVETVNGYVLNPGIYEVEVSLNETAEITIMNNLEQVDLQHFKIDEEWNEIFLDGAVFSVTDITEATENQLVDEEGNLLWEDPEETIPVLEREGDVYEFDVVTGNQYIRIYSPEDNTLPYFGKVEISLSESFEKISIFETSETGLLVLNELDLTSLGQIAPEDSQPTYFYRVLSDSEERNYPVGVFTLVNQEELTGWANMPLKWGREYEVCEIVSPIGYELPEEACKVVSMNLDEGISFSTDTLTNKRRRLALKLFKQNDNRTILLSGAVFTVEKILTEYEIDALKNELTEEELVDWVSRETEILGEYITGALLIKDDPGSIYQVTLMNDIEVSYTYTLGNSGEIVKYLSDGKYIVQKMIDEENVDITFEGYEVYISEGTIFLPELIYGHSYRVCETRAPSGYYIEGNGCEIIVPEAEYGIKIFNNYRINQMIKIPVMGE